MGIFEVFRNIKNAIENGRELKEMARGFKKRQLITEAEQKEKSIQTIDEVLRNEFAGYEIKKEVLPIMFGPQYRTGKPFSYCLYLNGKLVAAVMLVDHNKDKNKAYLTTKDLCENRKIPFIYFYTHMYNERQYVLDRIKNAIAWQYLSKNI